MALISVAEALEQVLAHAEVLAAEDVPLAEADGTNLAVSAPAGAILPSGRGRISPP